MTDWTFAKLLLAAIRDLAVWIALLIAMAVLLIVVS